MEWCDRCKEYRFLSFGNKDTECQCKEFTIIDEDGEEHTLYAIDDHSAALTYAEESNCSGDYYLMNETVRIEVDGNPFNISAEPDIHYSAIKQS